MARLLFQQDISYFGTFATSTVQFHGNLPQSNQNCAFFSSCSCLIVSVFFLQDDDGRSSTSGSATIGLSGTDSRALDDDIPQDLIEAARREKKLKTRIQELVDTLEKLSKNSEIRHQQTAEYIADLKRANGALVSAYEKAKKRHASRLKKFEAQLITMAEKHQQQVIN